MSLDQKPNDEITFAGNTMVFESVKRFALKGLNDLLRVLMENIDDALFELSEKVESDRERNLYFDAMRQIRLQRQSIEQQFDESLKQRFADFLRGMASRHDHQESDELSLVDQETMEGKLAIDNMISKARPRFEDDLFAICERFRAILHRGAITEDDNPLDPSAICESFYQACVDLDLEIHVQLIFFKMFDKFVVSQLGGFYHELNEFFIAKGVLVDLEASKERLNQNTRFMAKRIAQHEQEQPSPQESERVSPSAGPPAATDSSTAAQGNLLALLQQALGQASPAVTAPIATGASSSVPAQPTTASAPAGILPATAVVAQPYFSALSNLQNHVLEQQSAPAVTVDPGSFQSVLNQQVVEFKQQHGDVIDQDRTRVIDVVSMLFDFFFDDSSLPAPIKVLIGRLQIPILKLALVDDSFFNHKKHPARQLLDTVSRAALGWSSDQQQESKLIRKIEQLVEFLLTEFEDDVAVFEQALEQLKDFLAQESEQVQSRLHEVEEQEKHSEQQLDQAREVADRYIRKMLNKHEFEFPVIEFLETTWRSVLVNSLLSQGEDSKYWRNLKRISTTLVWTLIPKHKEEERVKLLKTLPPLLRALARGMELNQVDQEERNAVFKMLVNQHAKVVKLTSKNLVTRVDDVTVWPESGVAAAMLESADAGAQDDTLDIQIGEDETGEITIIENEVDETTQAESLNRVSATPLSDVVRNLEKFSKEVSQGDVEIGEEIILYGEPTMQRAADYAADDCDEQARTMQIGDWIEFREGGKNPVNAKLSWKSNVTGKYVFVNRHGARVKDMSLNGLAAELRAGSACLIESASVFDRAISSLINTVRQ